MEAEMTLISKLARALRAFERAPSDESAAAIGDRQRRQLDRRAGVAEVAPKPPERDRAFVSEQLRAELAPAERQHRLSAAHSRRPIFAMSLSSSPASRIAASAHSSEISPP